jgi:hypothetical protein
MPTKATIRQQRYDAKTAVRLGLKFHKDKDADILEKLDSVDGKQAYIKQLIRNDIHREKYGW